ncbi:MAG: YraN family protein [Clostridia bacterium]|nr:YraN family protein [Clostridia bacterium]
MNRSEKGKLGEDVCAWYLEKHGYSVVARNVHSRYGEVDLIAENADFVCFVEVKTRKAGAPVSPAEAVDRRKQQKLVLTAQHYLLTHETAKQPRFDVFEVLLNGEGRPEKVRLIEHAFDASCIDNLYY